MEKPTAPRPSLMWRAGAAGGIGAAFLVVDQLTKAAARGTLSPAGAVDLRAIPGILDLILVRNYGASFGLGQGMGWLFILLALAVAVAVPVYLLRTPLVSKVEVIGLGMVAGGAIGNAIDRLLLGYVTDFLSFTFIDFPVFNIADIGITCGVVIAAVGFLFLSPANAVDATKELNRRDAKRRRRRSARKGGA